MPSSRPPEICCSSGKASLFAQRFDMTRFDSIGEPTPIVQNVSWTVSPWNLGAFSVSDNGRLTYRLTGGNRSQFAWFDRSGRRIAVVGPPGDYLSPALSPDETKVAFTRHDDQTAGDIWTMDLRSTDALAVHLRAGSEIYPVWSSDGLTSCKSPPGTDCSRGMPTGRAPPASAGHAVEPDSDADSVRPEAPAVFCRFRRRDGLRQHMS